MLLLPPTCLVVVLHALCVACRDEGGFNTRPPPWEVRQRVDRRRDRAIKLEGGKATPDGDKYVHAWAALVFAFQLPRRLLAGYHSCQAGTPCLYVQFIAPLQATG